MKKRSKPAAKQEARKGIESREPGHTEKTVEVSSLAADAKDPLGCLDDVVQWGRMVLFG